MFVLESAIPCALVEMLAWGAASVLALERAVGSVLPLPAFADEVLDDRSASLALMMVTGSRLLVVVDDAVKAF